MMNFQHDPYQRNGIFYFLGKGVFGILKPMVCEAIVKASGDGNIA